MEAQQKKQLNLGDNEDEHLCLVHLQMEDGNIQ